MKSILLGLALALPAHATAPAPAGPLYLHLTGTDATADPSSLFAELKKRFEAPLDALRSSLRFSYVVQTSGGGVFGLNLIVETKTGNAETLLSYLTGVGDAPFHGTSVRFLPVKEIRLRASLEAGQYVADQDDPFVQNFALDRDFTFSSFAAFESFSNEYGYALLNPKREAFLGYLEKFVGEQTFPSVRDQALANNNMVAIEPAPTVVLEDGTEAGPGWGTTPFLPYKFFRNCYAPRFENGNCYQR